MVIKYKKYVGVLIYLIQIKGAMYDFIIKDIDDTEIRFKANINEIKIIDCLGNIEILSEVKRKGG